MATGLTPIYLLPYPLSTDPVNVHNDMEDLALQMEDVMFLKPDKNLPNILTKTNTYTISGTDNGIIINQSGTGIPLRITNTGTGNSFLVEDAASTDSTPFVIDASGNVGIGKTVPTVLLDVAGVGAFSGALTASTFNALTLTAAATGFTIAGGTTSKTLTLSNTLTLAGTDATTMTFPSTSQTVVGLTATQTLTNKSLSDSTTWFVDAADNTKRLNIDVTGTTGITGVLQTAFTTAKTVAFQDVAGTVYVSTGTDVTLADGGTNASLTASNGGIVYSTASAMAILAGTATAGQMLQSGASTAPAWSTATFPSTASGTGTILRANGTNWVATTATYPTTTTVNQILYSSAADTIGGIITANNQVLVTNGSGVPAFSGTLPSGVTASSLTSFGTSPTLTTPTIDTINASGAAVAAALWNTVITTGSISMGAALTTGGLNIATGSTFNGTVAIATGAGTVNKSINIGTSSTSGTTAVTIGSNSGATSTVTIYGLTSTNAALTTPTIDTINVSGATIAAALWNTTLTTGSISMGGALTTGGVNIATGSAFNGTVAIASGAGTVNKTINIGTASTSGTTTITIGSIAGAISNIGLNGITTVTGTLTTTGNVTIGGDLTVNGNLTSVNSNTITVDDKNLELGSVSAGTISTTGTIGTVSGAGPFTATITGMTTTVGIVPGSVITATAGTGNFGSGIMSVASIVSNTSITVSSTLTFTAGTVTNILGGAATDATANGGGLTLKGATDKTILWDSTNTNWTSSENWNIPTGKTFKINNVSVLSSTAVLGVTHTINATGYTLTGGTTPVGVTFAGGTAYTISGTNGQTYTLPTAGGTLVANPMTTLGDITYGGASGLPTRLAGNATNGVYFLRENVTASASVAPDWIGSTGSGSVVLATAPAIAGGTHTGLTSLGIRDTSAAFDITLAATSSTALTAGRSLTLDLINAARTVKLNGNIDLGGNLTTASSLTTSGAFALTLTATNTTNATIPAGTVTLVDLATSQSLTNKTISGLTVTTTTGTLTMPAATVTHAGAFATTITATAVTNATLPAGTTTLAANVTTTIGDTIYASATAAPGTLARLAGNTTTTRAFLGQTGDGTNSAAPSWTSSTGTGNVVLATSPSIAGGTHTGLTGLAIRDTSAAFDVTIAATSSPILTAARTLTINMQDAARTISLAGNISLAGTLTTAAAFTTSGAFATTITSTAISNATLPAGTTTLAANVTTTIGDVVYASATGTPGTLARLAGNTAAQPSFLTSTGNGTANTTTSFTTSTGSGSVVLGTSPTIAGGTHTALTSLGIRDTSAAFDVTIAAVSSTALTSGRTLTIDMINAARSIKLAGNIDIAANFITSGANSLTLTTTGATNVTLPTTGTLAVNPTTTIGDIIYASATGTPGTLARLAGNIAAQTSFLASTGNGTANTTTSFISSTGTAGSNVVLATSPTITTPVIDTVNASGIAATPSLWSTVTTGTIAIGSGLTTGGLNVANATTFNGTINIASGAGTVNKAINIGTASTAGTTAIVIGSSSGATSTISLNGNTTASGNLTVGGNLTVNGTLSTVNSNTVTVDDKNLELGSVVAGTVSTTGTIGTVSGAGPFTSTITGMSATAGVVPGSVVTATAGTGNFGSGVVTVVSVVDNTSINISSTLTFTAGTVTNILGGAPTDATANGGGITLKGATDKSILWDSTNSNWTSSEHWNLVTGKVFKINNTQVLSPTVVLGITPTINATGFALAGGTTSKTLTVQNTLTLAGTDSSTLNIGAGGTLGSAAFTASTAYISSTLMTTLGDTIYGGASGASTRLAGNTTTTRRFLRQVGDGTNSAAPAWDSLVDGDIPSALTGKSYNGLTLTSTTGTFTLTAAKTFAVQNSITLSGTDSSTLNIGTGGTLGTAAYTASSAYEPAITTLAISKGGTGTGTAPTQNGIIYASATTSYASTAAGTTGQVLIGNTSAAPSWTNINTLSVGSAATLTTPRLINGISFDGSANITIPAGAAAAGTLTGSTLASGVVNSSLTSVGTLTSLVVSGNLTVSGVVTVPTPTNNTDAANKAYVDSVLNAGVPEIVPLDDIRGEFNDLDSRFMPKYQGITQSITNPLRLMLSINGIIQYVDFPDYVWQSPLPREGFQIDNDGYIAFSEVVPAGSSFDARIMPGPNTITKTRQYPFKAVDILLGG